MTPEGKAIKEAYQWEAKSQYQMQEALGVSKFRIRPTPGFALYPIPCRHSTYRQLCNDNHSTIARTAELRLARHYDTGQTHE